MLWCAAYCLLLQGLILLSVEEEKVVLKAVK